MFLLTLPSKTSYPDVFSLTFSPPFPLLYVIFFCFIFPLPPLTILPPLLPLILHVLFFLGHPFLPLLRPLSLPRASTSYIFLPLPLLLTIHSSFTCNSLSLLPIPSLLSLLLTSVQWVSEVVSESAAYLLPPSACLLSFDGATVYAGGTAGGQGTDGAAGEEKEEMEGRWMKECKLFSNNKGPVDPCEACWLCNANRYTMVIVEDRPQSGKQLSWTSRPW